MKYRKIISIKKIGKRKTFDLQVEDNNNFYLVNGPLSHNSGKSVSLKSIIEGFHDNYGYKIFDLFGGERNEGLYWTIPNQDKEYWEKLRLNFGDFDESPAKQYKVNLLYPFFESKLPKKLPQKKIDGKIIVNSKVFTIPLNDVDARDISVVIGNLAETNKYIWEETQVQIKKTDTCEILDVLAQELGGTNTTIYRNFIRPMTRERFLMNANCDTNLDLLAEIKDRETISVLCLDFVPEKFHMFIMNYLLRKMTQYLDEGKCHKKNIIYMRELGTFFRASDDSILEDRFKIFRTLMAQYMRMGRRGMYFAGDTQSSAEVRSVLQGGEDFLLLGMMTSFRDKEESTAELMREKRMRRDQVSDLGFLNKGEFYIIETSKVAKKVRILLPRTMYWKKEYPNFYKTHWESYGGDWVNIEEKIDYVNDLCKEHAKQLEEKKKALKEKEEAKKQKIESRKKEKLKDDIAILNSGNNIVKVKQGEVEEDDFIDF